MAGALTSRVWIYGGLIELLMKKRFRSRIKAQKDARFIGKCII